LAFRQRWQLDVLVKPYKNGCRCPECGRRGKIIPHRHDLQFWLHIPVGPWSVWLVYWPREIDCTTHGRVTERLPWSDAGAREGNLGGGALSQELDPSDATQPARAREKVR